MKTTIFTCDICKESTITGMNHHSTWERAVKEGWIKGSYNNCHYCNDCVERFKINPPTRKIKITNVVRFTKKDGHYIIDEEQED